MHQKQSETTKCSADGFRQDWSQIEIGDRVHVKLESGQTYFGVIDDADQDRTVVWIAAHGLHRRRLLHCEGRDEIWVAY